MELTRDDLFLLAYYDIDITVKDKTGGVYHDLIGQFDDLSHKIFLGLYTPPWFVGLESNPNYDIYTSVNTKINDLRKARNEFERQ